MRPGARAACHGGPEKPRDLDRRRAERRAKSKAEERRRKGRCQSRSLRL